MRFTLFAPLVLLAGCTTEIVDSTTTGHAEDPYTSLEREQREGPPRYTSRLHSCANTIARSAGSQAAPHRRQAFWACERAQRSPSPRVRASISWQRIFGTCRHDLPRQPAQNEALRR